jgi:hypothetical protein
MNSVKKKSGLPLRATTFMKGKPVTSCMGARAVGQFPATKEPGRFSAEVDFASEITKRKTRG